MSNLIKHVHPEGQLKVVKISAVIDPSLDALDDQTDAEAVEKTLQAKISDTKRQAEAIMRQAEAKVAALRAKIAREDEEAKQAREEAYRQKVKEGFASGFSDGEEEAKKRYQALIKQGNRFVDQAKKHFNDSLKQAEPEILRLSIAVAEKIIGTSLALDEDKWFSLVAQAVREVHDQETVKIMVAPIHFDNLNQHRDEFKKLVPDGDVLIYADSELADDACSIETSFGKIDAGVDSQLRVIKEKLAELMEEKGQ